MALGNVMFAACQNVDVFLVLLPHCISMQSRLTSSRLEVFSIP